MPIYLDNAATTRVCPEAARAALEAMTEGYGNPSSGYALGQAAAAALKEHRAAVAGRGKRSILPREEPRGTTGPSGPPRTTDGGRDGTSSPPPSSTPPCWSR